MRFKILFTTIVLLSVFTNFYNLEKRHGFGWDQERDAEIVYNQIIKNHKLTLIGPRVVNINGFFLSPLHYYLAIPFYLLTHGDPLAGPLMAGTLGVLTTICFLLITHKLTGSKQTALIAGLFSALSPTLTFWNVMYLPPLILLLYYCCQKIIRSEPRYIFPAFLLVTLAFHFHFLAVFLLLCLIVALVISHHHQSLPLRPVILGLVVLVLSFFPLYLFDLRHNFLNLKLAYNFFTNNSAYPHYSIWNPFLVFLRGFNLQLLPIIFGSRYLMSFLVLGAFVFFLKGQPPSNRLFHLIWLFLPLLILSIYQGPVSEYYYLCSITLGTLCLSQFIVHLPRLLIPPVILLLIISQLLIVFKSEDLTGLFYKKALAHYLVNQAPDPFYNLNYSVLPGQEVGFNYLLGYYGKTPQNIPEGHLYTITIPADNENLILIKTFGDIGLARR